jgi:hypothetical protein
MLGLDLRRAQYIPLVAFCLRHCLADFIICMCEFDFRQAQLGYEVYRFGANEFVGNGYEARITDFFDKLFRLHRIGRRD